jgi:hypothetical protein
MDVVVLLTFALFFTALVIATTSHGFLRSRLLLLNVAASCGVAALHESLRGRATSVDPAADTSSDAEPTVRLGVLGWIGPLIALAAVTAVVALGSRGNGPELGDVGSVWAVYALLISLISAHALLGRRGRGAIDPQEG